MINQDSLIGQALADDLEECYARSGAAWTDYMDLDYNLQQHDWLRNELETAAELAEVYVSEVRRFAA